MLAFRESIFFFVIQPTLCNLIHVKKEFMVTIFVHVNIPFSANKTEKQ